jgi:hypothetical protein
LNLIAPGAGLVIVRLDALGIATAVLFAVFAQVALTGLFIAPVIIPSILSIAAVVAACAVWLIAQWLLWREARVVFGAGGERQLDLLRESIAGAVKDGRYTEACDLLELAIRIDDEDLDLHLQMARFASRAGQPKVARRAWRRVIRLDKVGRYRAEALGALRERDAATQGAEHAQP